MSNFGGVIDIVGQLISKSGNWGAFAFGLFGMIVTGFFGYRLKRPMMKQAVENVRFTTTMSGMETLNEAQAARILFLEQQLRNKDEYEAVLIQRHHACEERCLQLLSQRNQ